MVPTRWGFAIAIFFGVAAFATDAGACSCALSGPPCEAYFQVDAVFVGEAQTITTVDGPAGRPYQQRLITFATRRALRGVDTPTVRVITGMGGGDCGYNFTIGEQYLVYAYRSKDGAELSTGICTRTRPLSQAVDDLRYFDELPVPRTSGHVFGIVTHSERDFQADRIIHHGGVPGVHVLLRGGTASADAQTDDQGRYDIGGMPPGSYQLQVVPPAEFSSRYLQRPIELRGRGCAAADFGLHYDGRISGVLLTVDNQPAAGVTVEALPAPQPSRAAEPLRAKTDSGGEFEFTDVPPGKYAVGVSLQRAMEPDVLFPKMFYPGSSSENDAATIEVSEGTRHRLDPLKLPPARPTRELTGVVVWPDGRPVADAWVELTDGNPNGRSVRETVRTDAAGQFTVAVHDGLTYGVRAIWSIPNDPQFRQLTATTPPFSASPELAPVKLVLVPKQ
jgi:hypothetical protein